MKFSNAISGFRVPFKQNPLLISLAAFFVLFWASTYVGTTDRSNWWLENVLVFIAVTTLFFTYKKMKFSDLSYLLVFMFLCLHVYGSKYTYAENPFGFWLQEALDLDRNHYDRIVHFSFGFLLAYPMRELFLIAFRYPVWVAWLLPVEITMSLSAMYELIEWGVADVFFPSQGGTYLGAQGDIWDAQKDIMLAFSGAILATSIVSMIKKGFRIE